MFKKVEVVAERVAEAVSDWMTVESRIDIYVYWETWCRKVAEHAGRNAATEKRAQNMETFQEHAKHGAGWLNRLMGPKPWRRGMQVVKDSKKMNAQCIEQKKWCMERAMGKKTPSPWEDEDFTLTREGELHKSCGKTKHKQHEVTNRPQGRARTSSIR